MLADMGRETVYNCTVRNLHTSGIDAGHVQYKNESLQNKLQSVNFYIGYFLRFHSIIS